MFGLPLEADLQVASCIVETSPSCFSPHGGKKTQLLLHPLLEEKSRGPFGTKGRSVCPPLAFPLSRTPGSHQPSLQYFSRAEAEQEMRTNRVVTIRPSLPFPPSEAEPKTPRRLPLASDPPLVRAAPTSLTSSRTHSKHATHARAALPSTHAHLASWLAVSLLSTRATTNFFGNCRARAAVLLLLRRRRRRRSPIHNSQQTDSARRGATTRELTPTSTGHTIPIVQRSTTRRRYRRRRRTAVQCSAVFAFSSGTYRTVNCEL